MIQLAFYIFLFIAISGLIMIATNVGYDLLAAVIPFVVVLMLAVGVIVGLFVALKNTFIVYRHTFFTRRGRRRDG